MRAAFGSATERARAGATTSRGGLIGEDKYRTAESSYVKKEHGCDHGEFELGKAEVDGSELVLDLKHMWGLYRRSGMALGKGDLEGCGQMC